MYKILIIGDMGCVKKLAKLDKTSTDAKDKQGNLLHILNTKRTMINT